jgi:hypothetical protein
MSVVIPSLQGRPQPTEGLSQRRSIHATEVERRIRRVQHLALARAHVVGPELQDDALQFAYERHRFWNAGFTAALERMG